MGRNRASAGRSAVGVAYQRAMDELDAESIERELWKRYVPNYEEESAITSYTEEANLEINGYLRGEYPLSILEPNVPDQIAQLDRVLQRTTLPRAMEVVRYFTAPKVLSAVREGDIFRDRGFTSTAIAHTFELAGHRTVIRVPKGYHAVAVGEYSAHPTEHELLLRRGTRFTVTHKGAGTMKDPTILTVIP